MTQLVADTTFEKIKAFLLGDKIELSNTEKLISERWTAAFTLQLENSYSDREVCKLLVQSFDYSEPQAYRDIRNARDLFGDVRKSAKEGLRYLITQWAIEMFNAAKKENDFRGMDRALLRMTRVNNLDMEDVDIPDPAKIQPPMQMLFLTMNYINSPYYQKIDKTAQDKINLLMKKFIGMADNMGIKDYLDILIDQDKPKELTNGD
jgi:hypothetical protein